MHSQPSAKRTPEPGRDCGPVLVTEPPSDDAKAARARERQREKRKRKVKGIVTFRGRISPAALDAIIARNVFLGIMSKEEAERQARDPKKIGEEVLGIFLRSPMNENRAWPAAGGENQTRGETMKTKNHAPRLRQAVELLHRANTRLMLMHTRDGQEFYIVPGGRVDARDALKILERPDVRSFDDGLFPGHAQQWRIYR